MTRNARDPPRPKIGAGSFSAWLRTGLREIRAALYPESNIAQQPDLGIWGQKTPGEVAEARRSDGRDMDEERTSILDKQLEKVEALRDAGRGRDDREPRKE